MRASGRQIPGVAVVGGSLVGVLLLLGLLILALRGEAGRLVSGESARAGASGGDPAQVTDRRIDDLQLRLAESPDQADLYDQLSTAFMQKGRETGDFGYFERAGRATERALQLEPDREESLVQQAMLLMTFHRFAEGLEAARRLEARFPKNPAVYGIKTDALVELGQYEEAVTAAQAMVDLSPDSRSYARVSYQRALHGDPEGAVEAMQLAVDAADVGEPESLAWYLVYLGHELMNAGRRADGEKQFDRALQVFPNYHLALAGKARARVAAGDFAAGIASYEQAQARVPLLDTAIALGDLYTHKGRAADAGRQYALVEFIAKAGDAQSKTWTRQLSLFWTDHGERLEQALVSARQEREGRADIYTCDALAWCLLKNGRAEEALAPMREAMRLGTRDARLFYHAGLIHKALGHRDQAIRNLKTALEIDPTFDLVQVAVARSALAALNGLSAANAPASYPASATAQPGSH